MQKDAWLFAYMKLHTTYKIKLCCISCQVSDLERFNCICLILQARIIRSANIYSHFGWFGLVKIAPTSMLWVNKSIKTWFCDSGIWVIGNWTIEYRLFIVLTQLECLVHIDLKPLWPTSKQSMVICQCPCLRTLRSAIKTHLMWTIGMTKVVQLPT